MQYCICRSYLIRLCLEYLELLLKLARYVLQLVAFMVGRGVLQSKICIGPVTPSFGQDHLYTEAELDKG